MLILLSPIQWKLSDQRLSKSKMHCENDKKHHKTNTCIQYTMSSEAIWSLCVRNRWKSIVLSTKNLKCCWDVRAILKDTQYFAFINLFFQLDSPWSWCVFSVNVLQNFSFWVSLKRKSCTVWENVIEWICVQTIYLNVRYSLAYWMYRFCFYILSCFHKLDRSLKKLQGNCDISFPFLIQLWANILRMQSEIAWCVLQTPSPQASRVVLHNYYVNRKASTVLTN